MMKFLAGLFGGPSGAIAEWFASTAGKIVGIGAILGVITVSLTSIYFSYTDSIREAEDAKNRVVLQQSIIKDKDKQIKQLGDISNAKVAAQTEQNTANADINSKTVSVEEWLRNQPTNADRESSTLIKDTFDRLYGKEIVK